MSKQNISILSYILLGLVPYTRPNMLLTFRPNQFFHELELTSGISQLKLKAAYRYAQSNHFISRVDNRVSLSLKARQRIQSHTARQLGNGWRLMVAFDIPESEAVKRRKLRELLRLLEFTKFQQSLWISSMDHRKIIMESIIDLGISRYVQLFMVIVVQ